MLNMYKHEGESQYDLEERRSEERPRWNVMTKEKFAEGSLGYVLFPPELEGRSRPETVFNKKLNESVLLQRGRTVLKRLADQNIITVADILRLPETALDSFTPRKGLQRKIKDGLRHYLEELIIPPHGRIITACYNQPQYPVPIDREQELIDAVEETANALKLKRDREFLIDRFGLYDGISKSLWEIKSRYGGYGSTRVIEIRALRNVHGLSGYITTPQESIARHAFNAVFYKDLQELPRELRVYSIDLSSLSDSTKQELPKLYRLLKQGRVSPYDNLVNTWELLQADLQKAGMSQKAQEEIAKKVKDYYNLHFTKPST